MTCATVDLKFGCLMKSQAGPSASSFICVPLLFQPLSPNVSD